MIGPPHLMPGAADVSLLRHAARLSIKATRDGEFLQVSVTVLNEKAGHHMPTDHPARNILLLVEAESAGGDQLRPSKGPAIPDRGGVGTEPDDYGGKPGRGFAKILEELWTETSPTIAYWNPTALRQDARIPALGKDTSEYGFLAPATAGAVRISARLIFSRAFKGLAKQKKWSMPDILMNGEELIVP